MNLLCYVVASNPSLSAILLARRLLLHTMWRVDEVARKDATKWQSILYTEVQGG